MTKEYNISKAAGTCRLCQRAFGPGEEFVATVRETEEDLLREDFCRACWDTHESRQDRELFGLWRSRTAEPRQSKRTFVDDDLLIDFFKRLTDAREGVKLRFRFVLALVLMRKKLLVYEGSQKSEDGSEVWTLRVRGGNEMHKVTDPHMDEAKIAEVSSHLGEILEADL
jgi:hypothetical protein